MTIETSIKLGSPPKSATTEHAEKEEDTDLSRTKPVTSCAFPSVTSVVHRYSEKRYHGARGNIRRTRDLSITKPVTSVPSLRDLRGRALFRRTLRARPRFGPQRAASCTSPTPQAPLPARGRASARQRAAVPE